MNNAIERERLYKLLMDAVEKSGSLSNSGEVDARVRAFAFDVLEHGAANDGWGYFRGNTFNGIPFSSEEIFDGKEVMMWKSSNPFYCHPNPEYHRVKLGLLKTDKIVRDSYGHSATSYYNTTIVELGYMTVDNFGTEHFNSIGEYDRFYINDIMNIIEISKLKREGEIE